MQTKGHSTASTRYVVSTSRRDSAASRTPTRTRALADNSALPVYSRRLREAREAHGISQRALGIEAGLDTAVASTRVNRYETGVHQPDLDTLSELAAVLGLPVAYFYAEDDDLAQLIAAFKPKAKQKR